MCGQGFEGMSRNGVLWYNSRQVHLNIAGPLTSKCPPNPGIPLTCLHFLREHSLGGPNTHGKCPFCPRRNPSLTGSHCMGVLLLGTLLSEGYRQHTDCSKAQALWALKHVEVCEWTGPGRSLAPPFHYLSEGPGKIGKTRLSRGLLPDWKSHRCIAFHSMAIASR